MSPDFAVIGGGVVGLFTAWELSKSSARVVVLERGHVGRESSWAGAGILSPLHLESTPEAVLALARWSQEQYPDVARTLLSSTGIDCEWTPAGALVLQNSGSTATIWRDAVNEPPELLNNSRLRAIEPALDTKFDSGVLIPGIAHIRNPRLMKALRSMLERQGVVIRERFHVESFRVRDNRVTGVTGAGETLDCGSVVVCAGCWSPGLVKTLQSAELSGEPVRGQMLLYKMQRDMVRHILMLGDKYIVPRRDGHLLVGSSVEHVGFDTSTSPPVIDELTQFAQSLVPALADIEPITAWAGLRPGSPDGIPTIGAHPQLLGLFANSGHYRNGVTLAPASARLLADLVLQRATIAPAQPYAWKGHQPMQAF